MNQRCFEARDSHQGLAAPCRSSRRCAGGCPVDLWVGVRVNVSFNWKHCDAFVSVHPLILSSFFLYSFFCPFCLPIILDLVIVFIPFVSLILSFFPIYVPLSHLFCAPSIANLWLRLKVLLVTSFFPEFLLISFQLFLVCVFLLHFFYLAFGPFLYDVVAVISKFSGPSSPGRCLKILFLLLIQALHETFAESWHFVQHRLRPVAVDE